MAAEKKNLTTRIAVIGVLVVAAIMVGGTVWMSQSASRDTEDAVRSVSLLYLDELAGRREQVVESNLADDIARMETAVGLLNEEDLSDVEHLQAYQAEMKQLFKLEKFAFVDTNGTIYTATGSQEDISEYDFEYSAIAGPEISLKDAAGEVLGVGSSEWMLIDLTSRRPVRIPQAVFDAADPADVPVLGAEPFTRFKFPSAGGAASAKPASFRAQKSHIDLNGHVNNVHYVEWMLEPSKSACPDELEIVFRSETLAGDEVLVETAVEGEFTHLRVFAPDGKDHATARALFSPEEGKEKT